MLGGTKFTGITSSTKHVIIVMVDFYIFTEHWSSSWTIVESQMLHRSQSGTGRGTHVNLTLTSPHFYTSSRTCVGNINAHRGDRFCVCVRVCVCMPNIRASGIIKLNHYAWAGGSAPCDFPFINCSSAHAQALGPKPHQSRQHLINIGAHARVCISMLVPIHMLAQQMNIVTSPLPLPSPHAQVHMYTHNLLSGLRLRSAYTSFPSAQLISNQLR